MTKKLLFLIPVLALFGQGCLVPAAPTSDSATSAPVETVSCPDLPQVYYFNKLAFSLREISSIEANVVTPLVAYYDALPGQSIVSIMIKRNETGITVDSIVDQANSEDTVYQGFFHPRTGSSYPLWVPEEVPPGYRG
jgi:hypothetical protein